MKKLFLVTSTVLILAGCGARAQFASDESILWEISGNGLEEPSYLLGTHHFAPISVLDLYPAHLQALESSVKVVGELDMSGAAQAQVMTIEAGAMPEGITYRDLLSEQEYRRLDEKLTSFFGGGLDRLGGFKPAMLLNMYLAVAYMQVNPDFSPMTHVAMDDYVQKVGTESGKEIIGLETLEEQIELLLNFEPLEVQAALLLCTLENDEGTGEQLKLLDRLYGEGRLQEMYNFSFDNDDDPCPMTEEFNRAVNKLRNERWLAALPVIMAEGPAFIAVGALHLPGEEGLINGLRSLGYSVKPIR